MLPASPLLAPLSNLRSRATKTTLKSTSSRVSLSLLPRQLRRRLSRSRSLRLRPRHLSLSRHLSQRPSPSQSPSLSLSLSSSLSQLLNPLKRRPLPLSLRRRKLLRRSLSPRLPLSLLLRAKCPLRKKRLLRLPPLPHLLPLLLLLPSPLPLVPQRCTLPVLALSPMSTLLLLSSRSSSHLTSPALTTRRWLVPS